MRLKNTGLLLLLLLMNGWIAAQVDLHSTNEQTTVKNTVKALPEPVIPAEILPGRHEFRPVWTEDVYVSSIADAGKKVKAPYFKGAGFDATVPNIPVLEVLVPLKAGERAIVSQVSGEGMQELMTDQFAADKPQQINEWYPRQQVVAGEIVTRQRQNYQVIRIYPVQLHQSGSRIRKTDVIQYTITTQQDPALLSSQYQKTSTYAPNSVLAGGDWYKLGIMADGVYRLDYSYIQSLGIDPGMIDPRTIRIYGNGGGMVPQRNSDPRIDDLAENNIVVVGENDGVFDAGDYILFFGQGPNEWKYDPWLGKYCHYHNAYSDTNFYFLTYGGAMGARVPDIASQSGASFTPTSTVRYTYYEKDFSNPLMSGRSWLGDAFEVNQTRNFSFPNLNLAPGSTVKVTSRAAARSNYSNTFTVKEGGSTVTTINVTNVNTAIYEGFYYRTNTKVFDIPASQLSDNSLDLQYTYSNQNIAQGGQGWLDFIEIQYNTKLEINGQPQFWFTAHENTGPGQVFQYNISGGSGQVRIWNITDPVNVSQQVYSLSGNTMSFGVSADSIRNFVAFNPSQCGQPISAKKIANQNLHALPAAEYLIITHPKFMSAANTLADFHRTTFNRSVHVVNVKDIFNEFSSGRLDPAGIRDFIRMFYVKYPSGNDMLRYVLFMGDGSYDYKNRVTSAEMNFIPTYQSRKAQRITESYTSDDFYGFLDDNEGFWGEQAAFESGIQDLLWYYERDTVVTTHHLDIGIGRLPVNTDDEAFTVVSKIKSYYSSAAYGPWRQRLMIVADHKDEDGNTHVSQADSYSSLISSANSCINIDKVYLDNYQMVSTADGQRFPDAKDALLEGLDNGALIVNYTGHGGETGWSNARILEVTDMKNLQSGKRLPAYITATCEFGRFDDPNRASGAEIVLLNPEGSIAMFTTVRVVYSGPNFYLNKNFYNHVLTWDSTLGRMLTMGEVFMRTKNQSWLGSINNRNFTLMGDPALALAYPEHRAKITQINGLVPNPGDTLHSLSLITINGEIQDAFGQKLNNYTGDLYMTVYDKPSKFITKRVPFTFYWQKNKVFNGLASVSNGDFSFQFVVPIDVSYDAGYAKVSMYSMNTADDAGGCLTDIYVGGTDSTAITDNKGPEIDIYMNDETWADGGVTDQNPVLKADVFDENGINTVGTGIGHELTGVLDEDDDKVYILNDYYTSKKDNYKEGKIEYQLKEMAEGEHTIRVKVWDVANNSAEAETRFVVASDAKIALGHVLNYPNPFSTRTQFMVEHNQNGHMLEAMVKIYTVSGKLIKTLNSTFYAEGNLFNELEWDGLDEYGDKIGRGVYIYQVSLKDLQSGEKVSKYEKLVVLR